MLMDLPMCLKHDRDPCRFADLNPLCDQTRQFDMRITGLYRVYVLSNGTTTSIFGDALPRCNTFLEMFQVAKHPHWRVKNRSD